MTKTEHAKQLAALGFYVFPVIRNGKTPAVEGWQDKATRTPGDFGDYNIGISTSRFGNDEALIVIDIDMKGTKNGNQQILKLELEGCDFPVTRTHYTPTGGRHLIYRVKQPVRQGSNVLGPGVDIRSRGGYIVGAGSSVPAGEYSADAGDIAAAPDWLVIRLGDSRADREVRTGIPQGVDAPSATDRAVHYLTHEAPLAIEGEGGDETTFKVAARIKDLGVAETDAVGLLDEHWNGRCLPPWPINDLMGKVANAYDYGKNAVGVDAPEAVFKPIPQEHIPTDDIEFVDFASLAHRQPPPREWVVDEYVPRRAVTALFGPGGHGKSLVAQQLASSVANGEPWIGLNVASGPVLGIFCEDDRDEMLRRGQDIFNDLKLAPGEGSANLYLDARAGKPNAMVTFTQARNPVEAPLLKRLREYITKVRPVLVILDNIAQIFAGQENVRGEVTPFVNILTGLAIEFDCAILLLGHTAKAEGSQYSGSTAWDAAVRSRLLLERNDDGTSTLKKLKANYSSLDERRLEWRQGVFHDVPQGAQLTPETVAANKQTVLQALATFTTRQQACSHLPTARNFLGTLMRKENMIGKSPLPAITATINALVEDGTLLINQQLAWKTGSRHWATGLVQA